MSPWRRASSSSSAAASPEATRPLASANARVSPEISSADEEEREADEGRWSALVPELLTDILRRVQAGAERWPRRRDVVACACVCRRWREAAVALVRPPLEGGGITLLSSLKQPGPRDAPMQCFIKRNKNNLTFYLYLGLTQDARSENVSKKEEISGMCCCPRATTNNLGRALAQHRIRSGLRMEYIISIHSNDLSHGNHVGKLKSDFTRTKFTDYDQLQQCKGAKVPISRSSRWLVSKQINPRVSSGYVEIGEVSYEYNLLKSRGPRRIQCTIQCPVDEGTSIVPDEVTQSTSLSSLILNNKIPRWHEQLQCWCLNFHGRVMVASVKNFQLVAPVGTGEPCGVRDDETVILQFGKVEEDVFTMDFRQPLSAFQAFAICLTSFGSKLACE